MGYTEEEMAQYQRLSNNYVAEVEGPLVSPRQPSQNIIAEYAQADAIYVRKTTVTAVLLSTIERRLISLASQALAQKFSSYRTVRGDGNCGWRAVAFGYFEALLHSSDPNRALAEVARLKSLNNLLDSVGYDRIIYEDFVDETLTMLQLIPTLPTQDDGTALLEALDRPGVWDAIIAHFRFVTSAWMKTHSNKYVPFIPEQTSIDQYRSVHIEPHAVEIEHLGLQALVDAIVQPAGIAVQVLYLDLSPSDQVNDHWPAAAPSPNASYDEVHTIRLLYRPGHYDILYKLEDLPVLSPTIVTNPQINLMSDPVYMPHSNLCFSQEGGLDMNQFFLPGFVSAGMSSMPFSTTSFSPNPTCAPYVPPITPATTESFSTPYCSPQLPLAQPPPVPGLDCSGGFRPSKFQVEQRFINTSPPQPEPCQTEAMKQ
ncbi:MAG: hypothetical protein LQ352_001021 [Teloschistes flavicans]|nr:MAG: hypothetical protein LQ352_001021 [Teloschistes flavicans]